MSDWKYTNNEGQQVQPTADEEGNVKQTINLGEVINPVVVLDRDQNWDERKSFVPDGEDSIYEVIEPTQTMSQSEYNRSSSAFHPEDTIEFIDVLTGGGFRNFSPTQWARRAYDVKNLIGGNMSWTDYINNWIYGNKGIVSNEFFRLHPTLSTAINGAADITSFSLANGPLLLSRLVDTAVQHGVSSFAGLYGGQKLGEMADNYFPGLQGAGKDIGVILGTMVGTPIGGWIALKNTGKTPFIHTKYNKLNDILNYPVTTLSATVKGKYPWTTRQTIRLNRKILEDINKAREFQERMGYPLEKQPTLKIVKKPEDYMMKGALGFYTPYFNSATVQKTINPYSNIPIEAYMSLGNFGGLVNHEFTHGYQQYAGDIMRFDPDRGYYVLREDVTAPELNIFRERKPGKWTSYPNEFEAELSNLQFMTGKSPTEPIENILPLQLRFGIWSKKKAREIENFFLNRRKNNMNN